MWINAVLILVLMISVVTDLKSRKIYNNVIFPGLAAAFAVHFLTGGWVELGEAAIGCFIGFGVLLIPYLLGGMGAGDVKLLALVGALKGTYFVLAASIYMALIGAAIAVVVLLCRKGTGARLWQIVFVLYGLRYGVKIPLFVEKSSLSAAYPYGVAIAGGAVLCLGYKGWGSV
ncbi:MAG: prepilin peptidase [Bacilli bacterium]|nr:prepilin peptidase [Bacilli bacterium]